MTATLCGTPASNPWQAFAATIAQVRQETPGVATFDLEVSDPGIRAAYRYQPGQFNMLYLPGIGESAISISGGEQRTGVIPHTVRMAGNVTRALFQLQPGDGLAFRGPFGSYWPLDACRGRDVVVVAGGIGLAPLRPVVEAIHSNPADYGHLTILCGARGPQHLLYQAEYDRWRSGGATVEVTVDRSTKDWLGPVGVVTLLMDRIRLPNPQQTIVLICGPEVMMWYTVKSALARGIDPANIWVNMERNMNCAVGLCGHCQFGPAFICKDGPILPYDRIAPYLKLKDL